MQAGGLGGMYLTKGAGEIEPLASYDETWTEEAIRVFEGEFTVDTDKIKMVNIVLGLWALTAAEIQQGGEMTQITRIITNNRNDVFPKVSAVGTIGSQRPAAACPCR